MNLIKPQFHMQLKRTYDQYSKQQLNIHYSYFIQPRHPNNILHVCTVHQQYQSTFLLMQLMHTIIKSQEC